MHATRNWATMGVSFSDPPFEILDWPVALNQMIKITLNWKNSHFFWVSHADTWLSKKGWKNRRRNTASKDKSNSENPERVFASPSERKLNKEPMSFSLKNTVKDYPLWFDFFRPTHQSRKRRHLWWGFALSEARTGTMSWKWYSLQL